MKTLGCVCSSPARNAQPAVEHRAQVDLGVRGHRVPVRADSAVHPQTRDASVREHVEPEMRDAPESADIEEVMPRFSVPASGVRGKREFEFNNFFELKH